MAALSAYMAAAATRELPGDIAEHARHHLLDTLALIISGLELPPGRAAQRYIRAFGGAGAATIAAVRLTAPPAEAALANGIMAHADETDDSHMPRARIRGARLRPRRWRSRRTRHRRGAFLRAVALG
jgi:2-methylcitrate dehydratase PrpD